MKPFLAESTPCNTCGGNVEARNNAHAECSHIDCKHRKRWCNPLPIDARRLHDDSPRPELVTRQVAALFDSPERRAMR